ncbi:uncharacterized protein LOC124165677 isoform X2 [Ischnura elegans]|uniref:uncharacterized protein LOC124165677 isoform X2 n=1 Tax=Ischnura elegans TaxID=197161 RepID=UPI001ED89B99|nr:uncharacterized protein LOC124165677 isoform X2 [Ischnura elegans]
MWLVAEMLEADGCIFNVVPENWVKVIDGNKYVLWPPSKSVNVMDAIKMKTQPEDSWSLTLVLEMSSSVCDFQEALELETLAIKLKSCQKAQKVLLDAKIRKARIRIPAKRTQPGEESTEEEIIMPPRKRIPSPPSMREKAEENAPIVDYLENPLSLIEDGDECESMLLVEPGEECVQEKDFSERLSILEKDVAHIKKDLAVIKEDTKLILDLLRKKQVHTNYEPQCRVYTPPITLPVKSREELIEVEDLLGRDPAFKEYLENIMGEIHAKDLGQFLRKNLIKIMSNCVAAEYTWQGKSEKKKHALNGLKNLISLLADAARKREIYEDTKFVREISNWLYQSNRRKGEIVPLSG